MKIGLVLDDSLDRTDGVQQFVLLLGEWLRGRGHDVHYLVGQTSRKDVPNVHSLGKHISVRFNKNKLKIPYAVRKKQLRHIMKTHKFDVLHVQIPHNPLLADRIIKAADSNTAVVGTFHILPATRSSHVGLKLLKIWQRRSLKKFAAVCAVSAPALAYAEAIYGVQGTVIPNAVNLSQYKNAQSATKHKEWHIVYLGRLVERKGAHYLLEALLLVRENSPMYNTMQVHIYCDGPLRKKLEKYAKSHALGNVEFHGFVNEEDKASVLSRADIAVFPATGGESFGIVLIEAMAAGAGVVLAGDNPGYRAVLHHNEAVLFQPKDPRQLAHLLVQYMTHEKAFQHTHSTQQKLVETYSIESVGQSIEAFYTSALQQKQASRNT